MGFIFLLGLVFPVVGLIFYGFGYLEGRLQNRTAVAIRSKGRISILFTPMIGVGVALGIVSVSKWDLDSLSSVCFFAAGMVLFQACWAMGEFGIVQGHRKFHTPDQDIPSVYQQELDSGWVKTLMPGRWLVLRILKNRICIH